MTGKKLNKEQKQIKTPLIKKKIIKKEAQTVQNKEPFIQGFVLVENDKKLLLLLSLLKKQNSKKIMVLVRSESEKFLNDLLPYLGYENVFNQDEFKKMNEGVLFTSNPTYGQNVDLIIQYDTPESSKQYIQKINQICGKSDLLLFLTNVENDYVKKLEEQKIQTTKLDFPTNKLLNLQDKIEKQIDRNYNMHILAHAAYRQYVLFYNSHEQKSSFDISTLDYVKLGKQYGFRVPPRINLDKFQ